jgi:hypothetical protein
MTTPDELTGSYGTARRIPRTNYDVQATLDCWIITAPAWHPIWSQYALGLVSLADIPDLPPANRQRADVTHELHVVALNPEYGPYDARAIGTGDLRYLTPVNIAEQFVATDEQACQLAQLCVRGVVDGLLVPETADAPERVRAAWHSSIHKTLAHPDHGGEQS